MSILCTVKWRVSGKRPFESARYHCQTKSSSVKTLCPKGTTRGLIMPVRVGIFLIAPPVIALAWLKEEEPELYDEDEQDVLFGGFNHLPLWYSRGLL